MRFGQIFKKYLSYLEDVGKPIGFYFAFFFAFVILENFLEIFSDTAQVSFALLPLENDYLFLNGLNIAISFIHNSLWWVVLILGFSLILAYFTRERITRTLRAVLGISWIIPITPIVDLIVSRGQGIDIHYIHPQNLAGFLPPQGMTPGEAVSGVIFFAFAFLYCRLKRIPPVRSLGVIFCLSGATGTLFALTALINFGLVTLNIEQVKIHPMHLIRMFTIIITAEFAIITCSADKHKFKAIAAGIGFWRIIAAAALLGFGVSLGRQPVGGAIFYNIDSFLLTLISFALLNAGVNAQKDIPAQAKTAIVSLAFGAALAVNFTTFYFALLLAALGSFYYYWPFNLKNKPVLKELCLGTGAVLVIILGYLFGGGNILKTPKTVLFGIFTPLIFVLLRKINMGLKHG